MGMVSRDGALGCSGIVFFAWDIRVSFYLLGMRRSFLEGLGCWDADEIDCECGGRCGSRPMKEKEQRPFLKRRTHP